MRFYDISITDTSGSVIQIDGVKMHFTSYVRGVTNHSALNIEMDIPVVTMEVPAGNAYLKIWGIDLNTLNKASNLNFKNITISAGMQKGLPLANLQVNANPSRNGIIFQGSILQAFGNWQGLEQTLDLIVTTQLTATTQNAPTKKFITLNCKAGASLSSAISKALSDVSISSTVNIKSNLVPSNEILFTTDSIEQFSQQIYEISKQIITDTNYIGIRIIKTSTGYLVSDNSVAISNANKIEIDFTDLIGQPTWLDFNTVQMKLVMRSDIKVGDTITMPKANFLQGRFFAPKNGIAYTGDAYVAKVRYIGNMRQPDSNSWVTVIDVYPQIII